MGSIGKTVKNGKTVVKTVDHGAVKKTGTKVVKKVVTRGAAAKEKAAVKKVTTKKSTSLVKKTKKRTVRNDGPLVSIVMPAHNAAEFIDNTIHSVLGQTYENWELIIVDDASSDKTLEVISEFSSDKIKVITCKRNGGAARARNRGIKAAKGEYLCFLDADDLWQPDKLEKQIAFMNEKKCAFAFGSYVFADAEGRPNGKVVRVPEVVSNGFLMRKNIFLPSTMIFNIKSIDKNEIMIYDDGLIGMCQRLIKKEGSAYGLSDVVAICGYDAKMSIFARWWRRV